LKFIQLFIQPKKPVGVFDFFKKKHSRKHETIVAPIQMDANAYLIDELKKRLEAAGHKVEKSVQYAALTVNSELEIATAIIESADYHPNILHLLIMTIHKEYFPDGIEENIVGIGTDTQSKVQSVLGNYLATTFPPIIGSFSDRHQPELDFLSVTDGRNILWHPKLGDLGLQGQWKNAAENEVLFALVKDNLKTALRDKKLNWLKLYIAKQADGAISGECLLNNEPWDEGYRKLYAYAEKWEPTGGFLAQKQFIMFRRCDSYDR
jgi:Family of unknown function (DUF6348)